MLNAFLPARSFILSWTSGSAMARFSLASFIALVGSGLQYRARSAGSLQSTEALYTPGATSPGHAVVETLYFLGKSFSRVSILKIFFPSLNFSCLVIVCHFSVSNSYPSRVLMTLASPGEA
eukprot:CAMPEP_0198490382 /NCGR_PEP_ID=MMETSP1462-20131121/2085_1 /TAXON_ID=1333877 /ORGANISM="Brandtodinium nutriculum, Strain RCC3387" /LENGTH=120 /DNA_ID=CAMNT_0044218937 /DNA_START=76 /DNA_END=434 /DNA_ORIENTATION=+